MPPKKINDAPSVVDALAEDAVTVPDEYPEGAPDLKPMLEIRPRSKRAQFKRKYGEFAGKRQEVAAMQQDLADLDGLDDDQSGDAEAKRMKLWADTDDFYQLIDELLALAAVDPMTYQKWSDQVEDTELMKVFNIYSKRSQPGEASSSTS